MWEEVAFGGSCFGQPEEESLYATLECSILATEKEIKQQFRRLALRHHPDKSGSAARFQQIREAFDVLSNPSTRSQYDRTLVSQLDIEEYLRRWSELVLTVQGFSLPLHRAGLHRRPQQQQQQHPAQQQQQQQQRRRCRSQAHHHQHPQPHVVQGHAPMWGGLLTRA